MTVSPPVSKPRKRRGPGVAAPTAVTAAPAENVVGLPGRGTVARPPGLGVDGNKFWDEITAEFDLGGAELAVLADACHERDLLSRLQAELGAQDAMVPGSKGQQVSNPLFGEIRQHRLAFVALVKALKLPTDDTGSASANARALVNRRWQRQG